MLCSGKTDRLSAFLRNMASILPDMSEDKTESLLRSVSWEAEIL